MRPLNRERHMSGHLRLEKARRLKKRKCILKAISLPVKLLRIGIEKVWLSERANSR